MLKAESVVKLTKHIKNNLDKDKMLSGQHLATAAEKYILPNLTHWRANLEKGEIVTYWDDRKEVLILGKITDIFLSDEYHWYISIRVLKSEGKAVIPEIYSFSTENLHNFLPCNYNIVSDNWQ